MHKHYSLFFILLSIISAIQIQAHQPKYEVRAAWITTAFQLDWPTTQANSPTNRLQQQQELIQILDQLQKAHFNTVLFQVRTRNEVLYQSSLEPFCKSLTGYPGRNPGYDPLAFAIEECHKRNMECHAWLVTIPLGNRKHINRLGNSSLPAKRKKLCIEYRNNYYLNPGNPETKEYLLKLATEITGRYDIDGIHFDYLRYPENIDNFSDQYYYKRYSNGRSLSQWRQDNLTDIVRYLYKGIKDLKPWVKVSSSPVGKYNDTTRYSSLGWNALNTVYQDVKKWLDEGIQDQIYPMMYFKQQHFYPFVMDWLEQSNGRHIIPGLGIYFLDIPEKEWYACDIERQINFLRSEKSTGQAFYRARFLTQNTQQIFDILIERHYLYPALQPAMKWLDSIPPTRPSHLTVKQLPHNYFQLEWSPSTDNDTINKPYYVIYASNEYPVDINNPKNILNTHVSCCNYLYTSISPWEKKQYFAVTAIDRYGNESPPIQQ